MRLSVSRRTRLIACLSPLLMGVSAMPALAAESLPMPLAHYADLCRQSGGSVARHLTGGVGIVQCQWPGHGSSECKVGANLVNVCGISCQSNACLKQNPARYSPIWPLAGGPDGAALAPSD
jgi:hypothetical protein